MTEIEVLQGVAKNIACQFATYMQPGDHSLRPQAKRSLFTLARVEFFLQVI